MLHILALIALGLLLTVPLILVWRLQKKRLPAADAPRVHQQNQFVREERQMNDEPEIAEPPRADFVPPAPPEPEMNQRRPDKIGVKKQKNLERRHQQQLYHQQLQQQQQERHRKMEDDELAYREQRKQERRDERRELEKIRKWRLSQERLIETEERRQENLKRQLMHELITNLLQDPFYSLEYSMKKMNINSIHELKLAIQLYLDTVELDTEDDGLPEDILLYKIVADDQQILLISPTIMDMIGKNIVESGRVSKMELQSALLEHD